MAFKYCNCLCGHYNQSNLSKYHVKLMQSCQYFLFPFWYVRALLQWATQLHILRNFRSIVGTPLFLWKTEFSEIREIRFPNKVNKPH
jgi:hypothetical protein